MAIIFENQGSIDPRAMTTMGINVKEGDSPIGYFGTGLKYAIAVLLRLGQGVVVHTSGRVYTFTLKPIEVRGKSFDLVCMNGTELGFTTEYGKNWELWMAYRELWSNAKDEGGRVYEAQDLSDAEGLTQIVVDGIEFDEVHYGAYQFLLTERPPARVKLPEIEIFDGSSEYVFYRGIRAGKVPAGKKSRFTYNFLCTMQLSEDRTLNSPWEIQSTITQAIIQATDKGFLIACLTEQDEETVERNIDYDQSYIQASPEFLEVVGRLIKSNSGKLNDKALRKYRKQTAKTISPDGRPILSAEAEVIKQAQAFALQIGFPSNMIEVRVSDNLAEGTLALAIRGENVMVLSNKLFGKGWQLVAQAIIEESIHIRQGYGDCSRDMQTHLFEQIMRLGQLIPVEVEAACDR